MQFEQLNISERKIIVGIDFGTTYSGLAWAETQRPERRSAITSVSVSSHSQPESGNADVASQVAYIQDCS
jgi:molecular chaperone DnaK (HSP70)